MHITSFPENKLELKAVLKVLSGLWSQIMWLGFYFSLINNMPKSVAMAKKLEIIPELTWCANISVSSPLAAATTNSGIQVQKKA